MVLLSGSSVIPSAAHAAASAEDAAEPRIVVSGTRDAGTGYKTDRSTTGTKTDTPLVDTPQSVSVVTVRNIEDRASNGIGDAIAYVPGVQTAQGENNRETIVLRGNSTTGDFFVDGVRDDVQTYRDLYNIERLEVFRGPNAMIFGRGGIGGVINRVIKVADWAPRMQGRIEAGSYNFLRGQVDFNQPLNDAVAVRITGVWQDANGFRDDTRFDRWGVNPTAAIRLGASTLLTLSYEHFLDQRVAERGVPAAARINGITATQVIGPLATDPSTVFGDPLGSPTFTNTDAATAALYHEFSDTVSVRSRLRYADYDKFYQNIFPNSVNAAAVINPAGLAAGTYAPGTIVQIQAYNNQQLRENLFSQTDLNAEVATGPIKHTLLVGIELGRQKTDNIRNEGFFPVAGNAAGVATIFAPLAQPNIRRPDTIWRPTASSGNNEGTADVIGVYAQDQLEFAPWLQAIVGLRYDDFHVEFRDRRSAAFRMSGGVTSPELYDVRNRMWSPRVGLIVKPAPHASLYAAFSRTFQPRAGDQLASLNVTNAAFDPERFDNYEVGVKWDVVRTLALTAALYRLDRDNVIVPDPANPTMSILAGAQRTQGFELGVAGELLPSWSVQGGYSYQDGAFTKSLSATVPAGNRPANLPEHAASLWSRYDLGPIGIGMGAIYQSSRFAATDNLVRLPAFTRIDAALFYRINGHLRGQVNVENLFDTRYFANANSNNNISPGSPRAFKAALTASF